MEPTLLANDQVVPVPQETTVSNPVERSNIDEIVSRALTTQATMYKDAIMELQKEISAFKVDSLKVSNASPKKPVKVTPSSLLKKLPQSQLKKRMDLLTTSKKKNLPRERSEPPPSAKGKRHSPPQSRTAATINHSPKPQARKKNNQMQKNEFSSNF
ncbi:hypothetical protein O181_014012 [Austropuccinia psidii MF-1]|uniref:Uncharacterized protein n=1 Tax=Austropuccinia psidii MF-1 TaxID=1389203 RepID=A0A9Q3GPG6_9BASI|nr:hypothetical protein [Austropuccinia psidii MF-1]